MSHIWSYSPTDAFKSDYQPHTPRIKKKRPSSWVAPEHARLAADMKRDFVRNERGQAISTDKRVVLDRRPAILVPERPKRYLTLVKESEHGGYR